MDATSPIWINTQAQLDHANEALRAASLWAVDTEFVRRSTYFAELGLVQIATVNSIFLIDPLAKLNTDAFAETLAQSDAIKILHSVGEDLEVLRDTYLQPRGLTLKGPIFDTQVAATLAGIGPMMSLAKLVQQQLNQPLDKAETTSDWLKRPLTEAQLRYAAEDVRVLLPIYQQLRDALLAKGRLDWVFEDCHRQLEKSHDMTPELQPHHRHKGAIKLALDAQQKLWRLLRWRDVKARVRNLPKNWVLPIEAAFEFSERLFRDETHFQREVDTKAPKISKRGPELWKVLNSEDLAGFVAIPQPLAGAALARYKALKEHIEAQAAVLELPSETLANRRIVEALATSNAVPELCGWRGQFLVPDALRTP